MFTSLRRFALRAPQISRALPGRAAIAATIAKPPHRGFSTSNSDPGNGPIVVVLVLLALLNNRGRKRRYEEQEEQEEQAKIDTEEDIKEQFGKAVQVFPKDLQEASTDDTANKQACMLHQRAKEAEAIEPIVVKPDNATEKRRYGTSYK